jgi:PilZ domain
MTEGRRASRYIVAKAGTIKFNSRSIDCLVRNLSTTGAALEAPNQSGIPSRFVLAVPGDGLSLACRVVWRRDHRLGVAFG